MERFLTTSFVPDGKVTSVLIAGNAPSKLLDYFQKKHIQYILTAPSKTLAPPVSYHPDMQLFPCGNGRFIVTPERYHTYLNLIQNANFIKGNTTLSSTYPHDIAYNVARLKRYAFCNKKYLDTKVSAYLQSENVKIMNVKQGYAKCSVCIVNSRAVITADKGLHSAVLSAGFDSLLIRPGYVSLPGYDCGFIGGCSGLIAPDKLLFCGDITKHPDFTKIAAFCKLQETKLEWIDALPLTDIGSMIPLTQQREDVV